MHRCGPLFHSIVDAVIVNQELYECREFFWSATIVINARQKSWKT